MVNNATPEYNLLFKLLLIGNSGVGKSCLLMRYAENTFTENFFNTIGVDFKIKTTTLDSKIIKLQIWDTAGQERFRTLTSSYYRGAHGILIVYDVTDQDSFECVKNWVSEVDRLANDTVCRILIGNKCDREADRKITFEQGADLAKQYEMPFLEALAKTSFHVEEVFNVITKAIDEKFAKNQQTQTSFSNKLKKGSTLEGGPKTTSC
uniref:Ras-related protein Rab-1 n=1 Tax=Nyctotherus ovalis TaxID=70075 RepID=A6MI49_NYCOV|nr:Rab A61 [Nyctotherus ovalis]